MYINNLYNNLHFYRSAYEKNKMLHGVARTNGRGVPEEIIQQEVFSKKKGRSEKRSKRGSDEV